MKYFALFLLLFVSIVAFSQNKRVKVTMKNGTVLVGELKNISVGEYVTLAIAGADTKIPFSEVGSVDDVISSEKTIKQRIITPSIEFICGNFMNIDLTKASFIFCNSTCFSSELLLNIASCCAQNIKSI